MNDDPGHRHPEVEKAHRKLEAALDEACDSDVKDADTAELIRVEESLAAAHEAAQEAIAIRQRLGDDQTSRRREHRGENHRYFDDVGGRRWHAFAVYPSAATAARALPEPYQGGWLSFDSENETRRIAPIPSGWQTLPENELRKLCDEAVVAHRRSRATKPDDRPQASR
jgi:hypothetical protein